MSEQLSTLAHESIKSYKTPEQIAKQMHRITAKLIERSLGLSDESDKNGVSALDMSDYYKDKDSKVLTAAKNNGTMLSGVRLSQDRGIDGTITTSLEKQVADRATGSESELGQVDATKAGRIEVNVNNMEAATGNHIQEERGYREVDTAVQEQPLTPNQTGQAAARILAEARGRVAAAEVGQQRTQEQLNNLLAK